MTTSSEDVLLQVGQVRYKKGDGTLYVMNERLAWMMDHRDTVSVSHRYTDIKSKLMFMFVVFSSDINKLNGLYSAVFLKLRKLLAPAGYEAYM
jgi:hypothetical protein